MRNKFRGVCYRCGEVVEKGEGHFEKIRRNHVRAPGEAGKWRLQHAECAIEFAGTQTGRPGHPKGERPKSG